MDPNISSIAISQRAADGDSHGSYQEKWGPQMQDCHDCFHQNENAVITPSVYFSSTIQRNTLVNSITE